MSAFYLQSSFYLVTLPSDFKIINLLIIAIIKSEFSWNLRISPIFEEILTDM